MNSSHPFGPWEESRLVGEKPYTLIDGTSHEQCTSTEVQQQPPITTTIPPTPPRDVLGYLQVAEALSVSKSFVSSSSTAGGQQKNTTEAPTTSCHYHGPIMSMMPAPSSQSLFSIDKMLDEGPSEQHAVWIVADCGQLSISKGCTCKTIGQGLELSKEEEECVHKSTRGAKE